MATMTTTPPRITGYAARARWETVRIETDSAVYVGRVYVPETKKRLSDVLCDDRPFINLTEVSINDTEGSEAFVAINKQYVRTVRVVQEDMGNVVSIGSRQS
jgi:hypothetical protein